MMAKQTAKKAENKKVTKAAKSSVIPGYRTVSQAAVILGVTVGRVRQILLDHPEMKLQLSRQVILIPDSAIEKLKQRKTTPGRESL